MGQNCFRCQKTRCRHSIPFVQFCRLFIRSLHVNTADPRFAATYIQEQISSGSVAGSFHTAVILGSGLGSAAESAIQQGASVISYDEIPGMPVSTVSGHAGQLVVGTDSLEGILFLQGRAHYYEGHSIDAVTFGVRTLCELGIRNLIVTNAAGGIRGEFQPGDLMMINGHWSFLKTQSAQSRTTFPGSNLWSDRLREIAMAITTPLRIHEGVYAMMSGPNYETPAEVRMLQTLGVDAVGMSTVPESMAAAQRGVDVLGMSCITNVASGLSDNTLDHAEVKETAGLIENDFTAWLFELLSRLQTTDTTAT